MRFVFVMMVVALGSIGCGGGGGGGADADAGPPPSLTTAEYVQARARWSCEWARRCCMKNVYGIDTTNLEACTTALTAASNVQVADLDDAIAQGGVTYDGERAARCFAELETSACMANSTFDGFFDNATCAGVVVGLHQVGQGCPHLIECTGQGNECVIYENGSTCTVLNQIGGPCGGHAACDPATSYCQGGINSTCVARAPNGTNCVVTDASLCASGYCGAGNTCESATSCERL